MNRTVQADLTLLIERALVSLEKRRAEMIPFMSPAIAIDLSAFLSSPPDSSRLAVPLWSAVPSVSDPTYFYLESSSASWEELLGPYFTREPWGMSVDWAIGDRWADTELGPVFDPNDRYENAYMCRP